MGKTPDFWVHDLDPVIFQITENIAVRWYGLAYVAGFLVAFAVFRLYWNRGKSVLSPPMQESLAMALILGVVLGGRLGYFLLYDFSQFITNPLIFFKVWEGGMASHGGFAGVAIAVLVVAKRVGVDPLKVGDLIVSVAPAGLLFGRIANFINGELWGKVTDIPWAVIFPDSAPAGTPLFLIPPRHPSQLYEALLEGLLLLIYMQWRFWSTGGRKQASAATVNPSARPGHLLGEFLVVYSLGRWIGELFREPDAALILGMNRGIFYSILSLVLGVALIVWIRRGRLTNARSR